MYCKENLYSLWIYRSEKYSVSLSVMKCFLHSVHQLEIGIMLVLLCHSKSAACVISIISDALAVLCRSCTPKQRFTSDFVTTTALLC